MIGFDVTGTGFTQLDFQQARFRNAHTYRLYWLLKTYQSLNTPRVWGVEELRLAVLNDVTTYPNLADFRRALLDKVCMELGYSYETKKRGKCVLGIVFKALPVQQQLPLNTDETKPIKAAGKTLAIGEEWSQADANYITQACAVMQKRGLTLAQLAKVVAWCAGNHARFQKVMQAQHAAYCEHQQRPKANLAAAIVARIKKESPGIF